MGIMPDILDLAAGSMGDLMNTRLVSRTFAGSREDVAERAARHYHAERFLSKPENKEWRNNKRVMLAAVKNYGRHLKYASPDLRNDREVVLMAVNNDRWRFRDNSLKYASTRLRNDREVVLAAVKQNGYALRHASNDLRQDREIVLAAIEDTPEALRFASKELREDREIVMAAVKKDGFALRLARGDLKLDREILLAAIKQSMPDPELLEDDESPFWIPRQFFPGDPRVIQLEMDPELREAAGLPPYE